MSWTEDLSAETLRSLRRSRNAARRGVVRRDAARDGQNLRGAWRLRPVHLDRHQRQRLYPAAGFVAEARAAGAHTVELNLEPSEGASRFAEAAYGPATEMIVPNYVEKLLRF